MRRKADIPEIRQVLGGHKDVPRQTDARNTGIDDSTTCVKLSY